jgi:hypothetical protein
LEHRLVDEIGVEELKRGCVAVLIQSNTICSNSSVVIPACVAIPSLTSPSSPLAASASRSPAGTALKGSVIVHSGCSDVPVTSPLTEGDEALTAPDRP